MVVCLLPLTNPLTPTSPRSPTAEPPPHSRLLPDPIMRRTSLNPKLHSAAVIGDADAATPAEWEVRPGGMLVQKRTPGSEAAVAAAAAPVTTIRIKVKFGAAYHEIYLNSQSSFGELKKRMSELTGLHHLDQKVIFKDKERDSAAFLDIVGVKDGSKMSIVEDPTARAKRLLEARHQARLDKSVKSISAVTVEVDRLAAKVKALEAIVSKGQKVVDADVVQLIELLMAQLVKLDGIAVDGDAKQKRGVQVRRVQKYVEALDVIKIKNETPSSQSRRQPPQLKRHQQQPAVPVVVTTKWETFDSLFSPTSSGGSAAATPTAAPTPRFEWELF